MNTTQQFFERLNETGTIAILRRFQPEAVEETVDALIAGGIRLLELTVDSQQVFSLIEKIHAKHGDRVCIGAGTVLDPETAARAIDSGASFILSPSLHPDVIGAALQRGKVAIPGVMTPTEAVTAHRQGAQAVKLFPANVVTAAFVKTMQGPLPDIPIIPTGGVDAGNAAEFILAGARAVAVGGALFAGQHESDWSETLRDRAASLVQTVREAKRAYAEQHRRG